MIDNIVLALVSLKNNKMRSFLTMLGIIIGISSVIAIVTVGNSISSSVTSTMSSLGTNQIMVSVSTSSNSSRLFGPNTMSEEDYLSQNMIDEYEVLFADEIMGVSATQTLSNTTVKLESESITLNTTGVNLGYKHMSDFEIEQGRFFSSTDIENERRVCVIESDFAIKYFDDAQKAIGEPIEIYIDSKIETFYVVGVVASGESEDLTSNDDETSYIMYIPITLAKTLSRSSNGYSMVTILSKDDVDITSLMSYSQTFFDSFYTHNESYEVKLTSPTSMVESMTSMIGTIQLAISAIAAISLLVGGIGVMNIMLVSISERTREIGTRKALGAPKFDIMLQFVTEAIILCLLGGVIGILIGVGLGVVATDLMGYPARPNVESIIYSVAFSVFIGVFFGYYPASKAAKLDPIDALRYE